MSRLVESFSFSSSGRRLLAGAAAVSLRSLYLPVAFMRHHNSAQLPAPASAPSGANGAWKSAVVDAA